MFTPDRQFAKLGDSRSSAKITEKLEKAARQTTQFTCDNLPIR
jgi:hypothetical protein